MSAIPTNSQRHAPECTYVVDSLPVAVYDNIRLRRCWLYPLNRPSANAFRGYVPSKRRYFYGLRVHLMVTGAGEPVEFALAAGFEADVTISKESELDLPEGSIIMPTRATLTTITRSCSKRSACT